MTNSSGQTIYFFKCFFSFFVQFVCRLRDIHITYSKINRPHVKRLNADINWDANRDPNQKVSVAMELLNKGALNYGGSFLLFYPGRLINGEIDFLIKGMFSFNIYNCSSLSTSGTNL